MDSMDKIMDKMLDLEKWAVVGASRNKNKYGYKIYKLLKDRSYDVVPVNPVYDSVDGDDTYKDLLEINKEIDCISVVVSPKRAEKVVDDAIKLGIKYIWFQPGTFTPEIIEKAEDANLNVVFYNCVLVELGKRK